MALGGTLPGPPRLRARRVSGGYLLDGQSPWVTGWGMIDTLVTAARDEQDALVWSLTDAADSATLSVQPLRMAAVSASRHGNGQVRKALRAGPQVLGRQPFAEFGPRDAAGLRLNGSLALGVRQPLPGAARADRAGSAGRGLPHRPGRG